MPCQQLVAATHLSASHSNHFRYPTRVPLPGPILKSMQPKSVHSTGFELQKMPGLTVPFSRQEHWHDTVSMTQNKNIWSAGDMTQLGLKIWDSTSDPFPFTMTFGATAPEVVHALHIC